MRKAALHNLGCKVNSYETEAMEQLLVKAGYEIVAFEEEADVYIVNTCSVTNIADRKSRQMLHRAKKRNPAAVVVAAGCYVQSAGEILIQDGAVDLIIGNNKKTELTRLLDEYFSNNGCVEEKTVLDIGAAREYEGLSIHKTSNHTRAFIKVQDGCNQFCSYCIIPYTRGRVRSRGLLEVKREVEALAAGGCGEIVLTGIHLSSYGVDGREGERRTLLDLITCLNDVKGVERIRLGSLEPRIVTTEFAAALARLGKICPHFHLSLQSGCDATLLRMNRRYTAKEYQECCGILRSVFENPAITTDVIVGFPGETKEEFEVTKAFVSEIGFYEMHVFKYSKREGTRAAAMEAQTLEPVKNERSAQLIAISREASSRFRKRLLGTAAEILAEEEFWWEGRRYLTGYTREYVKAAVAIEGGHGGAVIQGVLTAFLNDGIMLLEQKR